MRHTEITTKSGLVLVRDHVAVKQDDRPLRRDADVGSLQRIRRGAYVDRALWEALTPLERYRSRVIAVVRTRRRMPVVGFDSAAALWGYPRASPWPGVVHIIVDPASTMRSKNGVSVHRDRLAADDVVELDGVLVTSPARTLVDLARTVGMRDSVAAIDRGLNRTRSRPAIRVTRDALFAVLDRVVTPRGHRRAFDAISFGNGLADNGGESESRVVIFQLGFPDPQLQVRHVNPRGGYYYSDTEWPEFQVIGEFDGLGKYVKREYLGLMTPGEAVHEEKVREDHLRAEGNRFARWGPSDLDPPVSLQRLLLQVGLPIIR